MCSVQTDTFLESFFVLSRRIQRDNCTRLSQQRKKSSSGVHGNSKQTGAGAGERRRSPLWLHWMLCAGFLPEDKENLRNKRVSVPQSNPQAYSSFWKKPFTSQTTVWVSVSDIHSVCQRMVPPCWNDSLPGLIGGKGLGLQGGFHHLLRSCEVVKGNLIQENPSVKLVNYKGYCHFPGGKEVMFSLGRSFKGCLYEIQFSF